MLWNINKVSEIKLDSNSCRILNSCGKAEVLTDVVSKGVQYIDLSYNNGMLSEYETLYFFDNGMFVRCRFTGVFPFVMTSHSENFFHGSS